MRRLNEELGSGSELAIGMSMDGVSHAHCCGAQAIVDAPAPSCARWPSNDTYLSCTCAAYVHLQSGCRTDHVRTQVSTSTGLNSIRCQTLRWRTLGAAPLSPSMHQPLCNALSALPMRQLMVQTLTHPFLCRRLTMAWAIQKKVTF